MLELFINGEPNEVKQAELSALLAELLAPGQRVAVSVNQQIVPRSRWGFYELKQGDQVDIFESIAGG